MASGPGGSQNGEACRALLARGALGRRRRHVPSGAYNTTVTTFEAEPEAPRLSVTFTVIVCVPRGRTYMCPVLNVPGLDAVPVVGDVPSPQSIEYDHGPLSGSLNDQVSV